MVFNFHGTGTTFYGAGDWERDGSFCTTKWIIVCFIPLIPLKSYRMAGRPSRDVSIVDFSSEQFPVLAVLPINFGQVLRTYLFVAGVVAWGFVTAAVLFDDFGNKNLPEIVDAATILAWGLSFLVPLFALWWWRSRERARVFSGAYDDTRYRPHP